MTGASSIPQEIIIIGSTVKIYCGSYLVTRVSFIIKFSSKIERLKNRRKNILRSFFNNPATRIYRSITVSSSTHCLKTGTLSNIAEKRRETSLTKIYLPSVKISNFVSSLSISIFLFFFPFRVLFRDRQRLMEQRRR